MKIIGQHVAEIMRRIEEQARNEKRLLEYQVRRAASNYLRLNGVNSTTTRITIEVIEPRINNNEGHSLWVLTLDFLKALRSRIRLTTQGHQHD